MIEQHNVSSGASWLKSPFTLTCFIIFVPYTSRSLPRGRMIFYLILKSFELIAIPPVTAALLRCPQVSRPPNDGPLLSHLSIQYPEAHSPYSSLHLTTRSV